MVYKNNKLVADIVEEKEYLVAQGGIGGRGNAKFKSSRNTAPRICENGTPGEKYLAHIVLKVMSDVGIIGKPKVLVKVHYLVLYQMPKPKLLSMNLLH